MRTPLRLLPFVVVLAVMAPPAAAEVECQDASGCTRVQGPWVQNKPMGPSDPNGYVIWTMACPSGHVVFGTDWDAADSTAQHFQSVYIPQPFHMRLTGLLLFSVEFLGVNHYTEGVLTFMPLIGCVGDPLAARARAAGILARRHRTFTHNLRPNREVTFRHGCRRGQRYLHSTSGVGFFKDQLPSARELRDVRVQHRERRGRAIVKVTTGRRAGDDERVALQIHVHCRS
jgi:hypothetical protein